MRLAKTTLIIVGLIGFVLAVGFFFQQAWATSFWPLPDTHLSYAFIAAILAGGAALGMYYLFVNPGTRLRAHTAM